MDRLFGEASENDILNTFFKAFKGYCDTKGYTLEIIHRNRIACYNGNDEILTISLFGDSYIDFVWFTAAGGYSWKLNIENNDIYMKDEISELIEHLNNWSVYFREFREYYLLKIREEKINNIKHGR